MTKKQSLEPSNVAAQLATRAQLVAPLAQPLKQIPIVDSSIVALEIPAPYEFIVGRRTTDLPPSLMVGYQQAQAALKTSANVQQEQAQLQQLQDRHAAAQAVLDAKDDADGAPADPEARAAAEAEIAQCKAALVSLNATIEAKQQAQIAATMRLYDLMAEILNVTLVEWNLTEYARLDGQPFNAPGSITRDDLLGMRESMLKAITGAILAKPAADADRKKSSTAS